MNAIDIRNTAGETVSVGIEDARYGGKALVVRSIASDLNGGRRKGDVLAALPVQHVSPEILEDLGINTPDVLVFVTHAILSL